MSARARGGKRRRLSDPGNGHPVTRGHKGDLLDPESRTTFQRVSYDGDLLHGKPHGRGVLACPYSEDNDDKPYQYTARYEGDFRDGKPHGRGVLYVFTHPLYQATNFVKRYEGDFRDGKPHGSGVERKPCGTRYEGEWRHGHPHGWGVLTNPDGSHVEGEWREGRAVESTKQGAPKGR